MPELVDVYPYRISGENPEFLILKRNEGKKYAGQWRMVAGKVESCEAAWQSGLRELREETGLFPEIYWSVPSINQFYSVESDRIHHIPVFAAQISPQKSITLDDEHSQFDWIESDDVSTFIDWPEQQRLIILINTILTTQKVLEEWKIPL